MRYNPRTAPYEYPQAQSFYYTACCRAFLLTLSQDGCTVAIRTGEEPQTGYAVSMATNDHPTRARQLGSLDELTVEVLEDFVRQNLPMLTQQGVYLGTWHNKETGMVFLDISMVFDHLLEAERLARDYSQLAFYDLARGVEIPVR
jgi:hypothetical protein